MNIRALFPSPKSDELKDGQAEQVTTYEFPE
jgi:hypothetical protein